MNNQLNNKFFCCIIPNNKINGVTNITNDFFINLRNKSNEILIKGVDEITDGLDAIIYLLLMGEYYKRILESDNKAAEYQKNNKMYYFYFYDFNTKRHYRLSSNDILLSKNQIFDENSLQRYIEVSLWNNNFFKTEPNAFTPNGCICGPQRNPIRNINIKNPYTVFTNEGFEKFINDYPFYTLTKEYLKNNLNTTILQYPRFSFKDLDEFKNKFVYVYNSYYKVYNEATFYVSLENRINQIKSNVERAKTSIFTINLPKNIFPKLKNNSIVIDSFKILKIYNTIIQSRRQLLI